MRPVLFGGLAIALAALLFFLLRPAPVETGGAVMPPPPAVQASTAPGPGVGETPKRETSPASPTTWREGAEWRPEILREFSAAGRLDENPAASERRLDLLAAGLASVEVTRLKNLVLDAQAEGDPRAVAVELLARARSADALVALADIALAPVPALGEARREEFERALRGRAIEGLGDHPSNDAARALDRTIRESPDSFLVDRAHRAKAAREGKVPRPEAQDREALRKL